MAARSGAGNETKNKGKLRNRYRARWAKSKTGIGVDEHRATHTYLHEVRWVQG